MYTLILDSSNTSLSVGLADDNKVIESISYEAWQKQSEFMVPEIDKLLKKYKVDKNELKSIIVAYGPGSYTGVRIAVTIAKTLALALNAQIIPVSSLHALKDGNKPSICLINARSNRSYIGVYEDDKAILEDQIMTNDQVLTYITSHPSFSVMGDVKYLGLNTKPSNVVIEMFSLKEKIKPIYESLSLKPIYMKD